MSFVHSFFPECITQVTSFGDVQRSVPSPRGAYWSGSHGGFTFPMSNCKPTINRSRSVTGRRIHLKSRKTEVTVIVSQLPRKKTLKTAIIQENNSGKALQRALQLKSISLKTVLQKTPDRLTVKLRPVHTLHPTLLLASSQSFHRQEATVSG